MTTNTTKSVSLILAKELKTKLSQQEKLSLLLSLNSVLSEMGAVYVCVNYNKQTSTKPSLPGKGHVELPGIDPSVQLGKIISVFRKTDNAKNRRDGSVGAVRFNIDSFTRGNGIKPSRPTCIDPVGLTSFVITGFVPYEVEAEVEIEKEVAV